ncbi:acyl-CoA dehydrogenase family protein [Actinomadura madurae]|uniref:acyl-CoA dehydrogenase family protein n=1 Tax=Actinomadura madurae TaxID=1993 RepID=UPI0020D2325F|nr:acyl-CoA dehydrogenase family protein [Actinomadura madurae]MCQ0012574.1 acyl-CoA dehydrogenase family protein [Actinomadura madurae]
MSLDPLPGDLYHMQELLDDREKEVVGRVRAFLEAKVAPIANDCWARAEFPYDLIPEYGELGIAGLAHEECPGEKPSSLLTGFLAMDMARVDPSMATFFGVHSGLAMGSIGRCGSPSSGRGGCPRWGGWRRSARSRSPSPRAGRTSRSACAPPRAATATTGC